MSLVYLHISLLSMHKYIAYLVFGLDVNNVSDNLALNVTIIVYNIFQNDQFDIIITDSSVTCS